MKAPDLASSPAKTPAIVFVAAVSENGVIGRNNALPWRLKSDMRHFRTATMGRPVVMGRKTFQSIGKPLPGRTNIVVSRDSNFTAAGAVAATSLSAALAAARGDALRRNASEIAIIGGAELFAQALPFADRLEITRVHAEIAGDILFPAIDPDMWREVAHTERKAEPGDDADMTFVTYRRAAAAGGSEAGAL